MLPETVGCATSAGQGRNDDVTSESRRYYVKNAGALVQSTDKTERSTSGAFVASPMLGDFFFHDSGKRISDPSALMAVPLAPLH